MLILKAFGFSQQGIRLSLNELSDGYRTTAALVMDIARHLVSAFGELRIEPAEDRAGPFSGFSILVWS